jgi:hypothetical protein
MKPALAANVGASVGLICHENETRDRVTANELATPAPNPLRLKLVRVE